jgi:copper chaperone NosL
MIVSSEKNAAQLLSAGEDPRFYDDIGCLARDREGRPEGARLYVRGAGPDEWLPVEGSWFAHPPGLATPMGYGIAAFGSEAAARAVDRAGRARRWADEARDAGEKP